MPDDHNSSGPLTKLWRACLLLLGSVLAIWLTLQILASIWGWLLLGALTAGAVTLGIVLIRRRYGGW